MARRKARKKKQFDLNRGLIAVLCSILTGLLTILALVLESGVLLAVAGLSTLATVVAVKAAAQQRKNQQKRRQAMPKRPPRMPASVKPKPDPQPSAQRPGGEVVKCTETGKPAEECPCALRHVVSEKGVNWYGGPLGRPIGAKAKEPRVPTTSRAKPLEAGWAMRRES